MIDKEKEISKVTVDGDNIPLYDPQQDLSDYYTKEQTDSLLQENYYNKQEVDDKLSDISSGESYTQGSGINISEDNVISIDDTVALKTDLNDYQEKITNMGENLAFSTLRDISNSLQYSNTGYFSNGSAVPFIRTLPITKGDNIDITIDNNRFKISAIVPDTSTFVTETDLSGRIIPENTTTQFIEDTTAGGTSLVFNNQTGNVDKTTINSDGLEIRVSDVAQAVQLSTGQLGHAGGTFALRNLSQQGGFGVLHSDFGGGLGYFKGTQTEPIFNNISTLKYHMDDVSIHLTGDEILEQLALASSALSGSKFKLDTGQAVMCTENSTDSNITYKLGHTYLIGGIRGAYTATDITPTSSVDLSNYPTNEDLEGRVIPKNSSSSFGSNELQITNNTNYVDINPGFVYVKNGNNYVVAGSNITFRKIAPGTADNELKSIEFDSTRTSLQYTNAQNNTQWKFDDVQTQISGNNLETNLTGSDTLNIGKVYTCISDSTSGTYKAGHLYLIGGSSGAYTATDITPAGGSGGTSTTYETLTVASTSWITLNNSSPYTYQATVTLTTTLTDDSVVELLNNQAVLFATYGFAIASISGQVATIYSIGQPTENVNLTMGVTV